MTVPVVLFTSGFLLGGMEYHVLQLGQGLVQRGFTVATICSPCPELEPFRALLHKSGIHVHPLPDRQDAGPLAAARRLQALVRTIRRYPGCILHLHLPGHTGGDLVMLAGYLAGARAIIRTEHDPVKTAVSWGDRARLRVRDRFITRLVYVSEQTRRHHLDQLGRDPRRCRVVRNGVDLAQYAPVSCPEDFHAAFEWPPATPLVGTVARLREANKGIAYFLEMARVVAAAYPVVRFLVVGDGPLRPALEEQAAALGLQERVRFTGRVPAIPPYLAAMTVFVMPSLSEGGPYTVLEALAMAKPVVATPVGLVPEVIEDHVSGLLVPPADSAALARAVLELLADPGLAARLGAAGRARVVAEFSLDAMIDGVVRVYREVA